MLLNLFTAVYCSRIIFDVAEKRGWLKKLSMRALVGETNFDFVRPVKACVIFSCLIIAGGLALAGLRGENFFDIDFTGGSSVQIVLKEGEQKLSIADVRKIVGDNLKDVEVSEVYGAVPAKQQKFKIVTSNQSLSDTKAALSDAFGDKLERYTMTVANVGAYVPKPVTPPTGKTPDAKETPAKETPAKDAPAKDAPAKTEPAKTEPANQEPMKDAPAKAEPAKSELGPETPAKEEPAKTEPAKDAPTKDAPAKDEPTNKQSQWFRPSEQFVAVAAVNPLTSLPLWQSGLLLQEDAKKEAGKDEPAKSAEPAKTEEAPKSAEPAKPAETAAPAEPTKTPETSINDPTKPAESKDATPPQSSYKSSAELTFSTEVNKQYLFDLVTAQLEPKKGEQPKLIMRDYDFTNASGNTDNTALYKTWTMVSSVEPAELKTFLDDLSDTIKSQPVFSQVSNVGAEIAGGTQKNALWALIVSCLAIVLYVWFRFQNAVFGFAAVIALVHDVLVTIGFLALSSYIAPTLSSIGLGWLGINPFKISLEVVAALLTIIGFSINDTIVIFDRIRELRGKAPDITKDMVNKAVNQTLGRTILTSGTVFIVTCILYFFGGEEIHPFSFAMLIGLISGTYSTVYIAAPIVLWFRKREPKATTMSNYTGVSKAVSK